MRAAAADAEVVNPMVPSQGEVEMRDEEKKDSPEEEALAARPEAQLGIQETQLAPQEMTRLRDLALSIYVPALFMTFGRQLSMTLVPIIGLTKLKLNSRDVGLATSFVGLGRLCFNAPAAQLGRRFSEKIAIAMSYLFLFCLGLCLALARGFWLLGLSQIFLGFHMITLQINRQSWMRVAVPEHLRGRALSLIGGMQRCASVAGPAVGGLVSDLSSPRVALGTFVPGCAAVALLLTLLFLRGQPKDDGIITTTTKDDDKKTSHKDSQTSLPETTATTTATDEDPATATDRDPATATDHEPVNDKGHMVIIPVNSQQQQRESASATKAVASPKKKKTTALESYRQVLETHYISLLWSSGFCFSLLWLRTARELLVPLHAVAEGLTDSRVGLVVASGYVPDALVGIFVAGPLMDTKGRKPAAFFCSVGFAIGFLALYFSRSTADMVLASLILGAGDGFSSGLVMCLTTDLAPLKNRAIFISIFRFVSDSGVLIGASLAGTVAHETNTSISAAYHALLSTFIAITVAFFLPETLTVKKKSLSSTTDDDDDHQGPASPSLLASARKYKASFFTSLSKKRNNKPAYAALQPQTDDDGDLL